ncbi:TIR domain-containing protein [Paenibacillus sp. 1P03SA]|uniref:TIR domain-containing protein n=1 Tax=Paenibacillus sp. 1P03SA TaxID=3132294 RepID=UPI0039A1C473
MRPPAKPYKTSLYLSCAWNDRSAYRGLAALLQTCRGRGLRFDTFLLPEDHPAADSDNERSLYEAVRGKMKYCQAVLIPADAPAAYSRWINKEIIAATSEMNKPLIAVRPPDSGEPSLIVKQNADRIVGWDAEAIVQAILELTGQ